MVKGPSLFSDIGKKSRGWPFHFEISKTTISMMATMDGLRLFWIFLLSIYPLIVAGVSTNIGRSSFPKGFKFGAGSSTYQVEGAAHEGGKGPNIWDTFSDIPGKIADGKNGDIAIDQYHCYKEDVQLLKYMEGSPRHSGVNEEGIAHYNNLINELLKNGIEPFVTLFHWDMLQNLEDEYGGFRSKSVVEDFSIFVEECFRSFGDCVKYWITINEPFTTCYLAYDVELHEPGRCSPGFGNCTARNSATEPYIVAHNMLLAHNATVKLYRTKYQGTQKGSIGMSLVVSWMVPFTKSLLDQQATQRAIDFRIEWFLDPLTSGKYPDSMRILVGPRPPQFTIEEAKELKGSFKFLGFNYHSTDFTIDNPNPPNLVNTDYILDARAIATYEVNGVYIGSAEGLSIIRLE